MKRNLILAMVLALAVASTAWAKKDDTPDFSKPDPKPAAREGGKAAKDKAPAKEAAAKDKAPAKGAAAKDKPAVAPAEPLPEKPDDVAIAKAKKAKKPFYTKFAEAKDVAWKCQLPLVVALLPTDNDAARALEAKVLKDRLFLKEFAPGNCVLLLWRLKAGKAEMPADTRRRRNMPPPKATTIDLRPLKPQDIKFLTAFAVSPRAKGKNGGDSAFKEMRYYPSVVCMDPACRKPLFYAPKYEAAQERAGLGAWLSQVVSLFTAATKQEPKLSPALQKVIDNPTEPKKWK